MPTAQSAPSASQMDARNSRGCRVSSARVSGDGCPTGVELRGLVVDLRPGEWYAEWGVPALRPRRIRLGDVDRIHTRPTPDGQHEEMWVSGHKGECGNRPRHQPCVAEYIALAAVERALTAREAQR